MLNVKLDIFIQDTTTFLTKKKKKNYISLGKERKKKEKTNLISNIQTGGLQRRLFSTSLICLKLFLTSHQSIITGYRAE